MAESHTGTVHPWPDAWLLLAVGCQLRLETVSLSELIARADAVQHAVPSFDEVDGGLARLSSAGLVRVTQGGVALTPDGLALVSRSASPRRPLLDWQEDLERALKAAPWSAEYVPALARRKPGVPPVVSPVDYQEALRESGCSAGNDSEAVSG